MDPQPRRVVVTGHLQEYLGTNEPKGTREVKLQILWRRNPPETERWLGSTELSKLGLGLGTDVELRTVQLSVDYREVTRRLTRIWEEFQPQFAVHVGLNTSAKAIILEQRGKNRGYHDSDIRGFRPEGGVCLPGGPEVILSVVSMKTVCKNVAIEDVDVAFSGDAGRYVCDYTYYLSLHLGNGHAALIHVPPLSQRLPPSLLGKALQVIILEMLKESEEAEARSAWDAGGGKHPGVASF